MSGSVEMENVFLPENEVGMWHWLFGKNITSIVFRNPGPSDGFVGIAAPSLARILPVCALNFERSCAQFKSSLIVDLTIMISIIIKYSYYIAFLNIVTSQIDLAVFGGELLCQVLVTCNFSVEPL